MSSEKQIIFKGSNYVIWKKFVELECMRIGVKNLLTQTFDEESKEEGEAQLIIMRSLGEHDQYMVATCSSAKEMIDRFERKYKSSIAALRDSAKRYSNY